MRRQDNIKFAALIGTFLLAMAWMLDRLFADPSRFLANFGICFMMLLLLAPIMSLHLARRSYSRKRDLASELARPQDREQIAALIQTLRVENTSVRNLAKLALIELLPTLQASDAVRIGDADRDILLRHLAISPRDPGHRDLLELFSRAAIKREVKFRIAILRAVEQIGGARELPVVERLARGIPTLPKEVQYAAQECLPYLQERATAQLASRQLLRASSADATASDVLLRAAEAHQDTAPEQLLRASEPQP